MAPAERPQRPAAAAVEPERPQWPAEAAVAPAHAQTAAAAARAAAGLQAAQPRSDGAEEPCAAAGILQGGQKGVREATV